LKLEIGPDGVFSAYKVIVGGKEFRKLKARVFEEYTENYVFEGGAKVKLIDLYKKTGTFPLDKKFDEAMGRR
jgi:hypothetical protein